MKKLFIAAILQIYLFGEIFAQEIIVSNVDFGRKRINSGKYHDTLYIKNSTSEFLSVAFGIQLKSTNSNLYITLSGGRRIPIGEPDEADFLNLPENSTLKIPLEYNPGSVGYHNLHLLLFIYDPSCAGSLGPSFPFKVTGTGVEPLAKIDSVLDFGCPQASPFPVMKELRIVNTQYEFADSLAITGYSILPYDDPDKNLFKIYYRDKTLAPGESLIIPVELQSKCETQTNLELAIATNTAKELHTSFVACSNVSSLEENSSPEEFFVSPNPANDFVTVHIPKGNFSSLELYSALGEKILSQNISSREEKISLENIPVGNYFLRLRSEKFSFTQPLIIAR